MEFLTLLDSSEVVTIGTTSAKGRVITTPVGVVVVGDAGYVRSQNGAKGKWYQRAVANPHGVVVDGMVRVPVTFDHVTDTETIRSVDEATHRKYGGLLKSLLLKPLLWRTRQYVMKIALDHID